MEYSYKHYTRSLISTPQQPCMVDTKITPHFTDEEAEAQ